LGEPDLPPGTGTEMGRLALGFAFETLGIRKLCGEAFAFNRASVAFHRKLGFRQEGIWRKHRLKNDKHEDIVSFALFRDNWRRSGDP
jgi:UDP-4-amino-4,6-dideoxy-N-acetyl-beta-L-altrosamine N-acetyltransferase